MTILLNDVKMREIIERKDIIKRKRQPPIKIPHLHEPNLMKVIKKT